MGTKREIYNAEGYKDTTAFFGMMKRKPQDKQGWIPHNIRRGEIYYIYCAGRKRPVRGEEQTGNHCFK